MTPPGTTDSPIRPMTAGEVEDWAARGFTCCRCSGTATFVRDRFGFRLCATHAEAGRAAADAVREAA